MLISFWMFLLPNNKKHLLATNSVVTAVLNYPDAIVAYLKTKAISCAE